MREITKTIDLENACVFLNDREVTQTATIKLELTDRGDGDEYALIEVAFPEISMLIDFNMNELEAKFNKFREELNYGK